MPFSPAYSVSKAAAFSLSQALRALLAGRGVSVHAVMLGPVDTDMTRGLEIPKASPESVARAILDGVENGEEEIFPDPMSAPMAEGWRSGVVKALERQNAALVQAQPVAACAQSGTRRSLQSIRYWTQRHRVPPCSHPRNSSSRC